MSHGPQKRCPGGPQSGTPEGFGDPQMNHEPKDSNWGPQSETTKREPWSEATKAFCGPLLNPQKGSPLRSFGVPGTSCVPMTFPSQCEKRLCLAGFWRPQLATQSGTQQAPGDHNWGLQPGTRGPKMSWGPQRVLRMPKGPFGIHSTI